MRLDTLVILFIVVFMAGSLAGRSIERTIRATEARSILGPTPLVPDAAQDHIKQYLCLHAVETGDYARAKGCI